MQTTGIFETHHRQIEVANGGDPITLIPFGDIHYGAALHASDVFKEWMDWAQAQPNPYYLGMGDYLDIASASNRLLLKHSGIYDSTRESLDTWYKQEADEFADKIAFTAKDGRLLGMIEGNHYAELISGATTTMRMCERLKTKYLGVSCFLKLRIGFQACWSSVDIWAHHGTGGSRLVGGSLNRVQQMAEAAEADIYLMGHDHKKAVGTASRLYLVRNKGQMFVRNHKKLFIRTGSYLKAYESGKASYNADAARGPCDLGGVSITLRPMRDQSKNGRGMYIDMKATV